MNWLRLLLKRKLIVGLLSIFVLLFGLYASSDLDMEMMPGMTMDMGMVQIDAGELNTLDMEETVINPVEDRLEDIEHVDTYETTITLGNGSIMIMFEEGEGDDAFADVEAAMNEMENEISDIDHVFSMQASMNPPYELNYDLYGADSEELAYVSEEVIQPRLESLTEVREVDVAAEDSEELNIELDHEQLQEDGVDPQHIAQLFQEENENRAIGELSEEEDEPRLRWDGTMLSVEDIEDMQISTPNGPEPLEEYASIEMAQADTTTTAWKNGEDDYVFLQIGRSDDVTEVEMTEAVRAEVEDIKAEGLPEDVELEEMLATADYITNDLRDIQTNVLYGGLLALVVLFTFLRSFRATAIVGISIPLSLLLTFSLMWFMDYSINVMTLLALGLGIAMMVDASIVILESIYRKLQQGLPKFEAVIQGTKEVSTAVLASMLTTVVVFLPIGILSGDVGEFIMMLAMVIIITLVSSVLISFTVIPVLSEKWIRMKESKVHKKENAILRGYGRFVGWMSWKKWRRWLVSTGFAFLFFLSLFLIAFVPMSMMPDVLERQAELMVDLENHTDDEEKESIADAMHERLSDTTDVADYTVMTEEDMMFAFINMTPEEEASLPQAQVNTEIMNNLEALEEDYPIENVAMSMEAGEMGNPVEIIVQGDSLDELREIAEDMETGLENIEGITGIHHSMGDMETEQEFVIDEEGVEDAGLTTGQVREQIEAAFMNEQIDEMALDGRDYPVFMSSDLEVGSQDELEDLDIEIPPEEETLMPGEESEEADTMDLAEFVDLETTEAPQELEHEDGERIVKVMASLEDRDLGSVNADVQEMIAGYDFDDGYTAGFGGQMEQQQEMMMEMMYIFLISIFLVYVVMAIQFNHLIHPLVIMSVIPMTIVGVILGLLITQQELNPISAMGALILVGIVLNNAILLVDRTKQLRKQGWDRGNALQEAGKNRMRPIFMTTLTTVAGMLPLALATGSASNYQAPMATVIIFGLLFATFITLLLVPSVYMIMEDILGWPKRYLKKRRKKKADKTGSEISTEKSQ
ncbi:efflux RND transporter permease subunit [Natribacillus halophilus]|uniref:Hydrophobic/amphiphilic exporter-1, HAE1 family n=1 Tax=Natribacillus halophilus TaxID=549003 RepID=A0A1G8NM29_9BACI|nr:efflux RND transporter permease subunit [Natribacillus halophilus]SDI81351.1 hydrophobic/amphiphilic exporter-1, HAE1 family [Natribacillus halophilus]